MKASLERLKKNGVGGILDYAAEDEPHTKPQESDSSNSNEVVARQYDYSRCVFTRYIHKHINIT